MGLGGGVGGRGDGWKGGHRYSLRTAGVCVPRKAVRCVFLLCCFSATWWCCINFIFSVMHAFPAMITGIFSADDNESKRTIKILLTHGYEQQAVVVKLMQSVHSE